MREQPVPLSQLIDLVNERFGTDFNQADQLFFDQIVEAAMADDGLRQAAAVNPGDKFELVFKNVLEKSLRRSHGPERGDLRAVHERSCLPEGRHDLDGRGGIPRLCGASERLGAQDGVPVDSCRGRRTAPRRTGT